MMRRVAALALCLAALLIEPLHAQTRMRLLRRPAVPPASGGGGTLTLNDLSCVGMFLGPAVETGNFISTNNVMGTAVRLVGGVPHLFQLDGKGNVYEFLIPTLTGNCSTAVGSVAQASILQPWGAWPTMHSGDSNAWAPSDPVNPQAVFTFGLKWDETLGWLIASTSSTYNGLQDGSNILHAATFNTGGGGHSLDCAGEWGVTTLKQSAIGTGLLDVPSAFRSTYGLGTKRWALGLGGYTSSGSNGPTANSLGMALRATDPPSGNGCVSGADGTGLSEGVTLVRYDLQQGTNPLFSTGPTCTGADADLSGEFINCVAGSGTPVQSIAPTTPYYQQTAFNQYSTNEYRFSWDPYGGHGWVTALTSIRTGWYDGAKKGLVSVMSHNSGGVNSAILASPAPTFTAGSPIGTATLSLSPAALTTYPLQIGDKVWFQTCTPIVLDNPADGCAGANGRYLAMGAVTAINNGTGAMTIALGETNAGGSGTPIAGGHFYMGGIYRGGAPDTSREIDLIQITAESQLGEVARLTTGGSPTRNPWDVIYNEEAEFNRYAAPFGCPTTANGGMGCAITGKSEFPNVSNPTSVQRHNIADVITMPTVHLGGSGNGTILVAYGNGSVGIGVVRTLYVVLSAP